MSAGTPAAINHLGIRSGSAGGVGIAQLIEPLGPTRYSEIALAPAATTTVIATAPITRIS